MDNELKVKGLSNTTNELKVKGLSNTTNELKEKDIANTTLELTKTEEMETVFKLNETDAIDLALDLNQYDDDELLDVVTNLKNEQIAIILEEAEEKVQKKMLNMIDDKKLIEIFNYVPKDDIVDLMNNMQIRRTKKLINLMKEGDKKIITQLLGYKEDSAGGIMTTEYIAIKENFDIENVIKKIKKIEPKTEVIETIFVIDNDKRLIGTANLRDVLVEPSYRKLSEITDTNFISVTPDTDQEEVANIASKYNLNVVPVINSKKILLGIITIDDIVDVMVEEQTEDMLQMGGVDKEETLDSTVKESIRLRLPWLFVNLITAFLAAFTVKSFEGVITQVIALSATMSIVTGMGGNAGTQTVSIIIRNIAMGKVYLKDCWHLLLKEVLLGLVNGALIGIVTGIAVGLVYKNFYLGLIIFLAMIGNLIVAGVAGLLIPLILQKLHKDPALSSTVFLTTATDVLGFFIFLSLAQIFINKLI